MEMQLIMISSAVCSISVLSHIPDALAPSVHFPLGNHNMTKETGHFVSFAFVLLLIFSFITHAPFVTILHYVSLLGKPSS